MSSFPPPSLIPPLTLALSLSLYLSLSLAAFDDDDDAFFNDIELPSDDTTTTQPQPVPTENKPAASAPVSTAGTLQPSTRDEAGAHRPVNTVASAVTADPKVPVSTRHSLDSTNSAKGTVNKTHINNNQNQSRRLSLSSKSQPFSRSNSKETKSKSQINSNVNKVNNKTKETPDPKQSLLSSNYSFRPRSTSNVGNENGDKK